MYPHIQLGHLTLNLTPNNYANRTSFFVCNFEVFLRVFVFLILCNYMGDLYLNILPYY